MKKQTGKLTLKLETIASLQSDDLAGVVGGIAQTENCNHPKIDPGKIVDATKKTVDATKKVVTVVTGVF